MESTTSFKGHLLVAMPTLYDPNFSHSVIYVLEHNQQGAMGLVINHPLTVKLSELLLSMDLIPSEGQEKIPVFFGGPLQQDRGFVLHRPDKDWQSTVTLTPFSALTTSKDILESIARGDGPYDCLIALGYAAWEEDQLEKELSENVWITVPATEEIIFDVPTEQRWQKAAELLGFDIRQISGDVGHA